MREERPGDGAGGGHQQEGCREAAFVRMMMAMLRLNVPSVFLYGGSIMPGRFRGKDVTVVDVFEGVGQNRIVEVRGQRFHRAAGKLFLRRTAG